MPSDLRHALRSLGKSPGFTAVVLLIVALGVGANSAIFSVVRSLLLRPLPMEDPDRVVRLYERFSEGGDEAELNLTYSTWQRWRQYNEVFTDIGAATGESLTLTGRGEAQFVPAARVSSNFFSVLGVHPVIGRDFLPEEDRPGAGPVALIGYGFWQRQFSGSVSAIGRTIDLDGTPHTVIGVLPPSFRHPYRSEVWVPLAMRPGETVIPYYFLYAPARLRPGVTVEQARRAMADLCRRLAKEFPGPNNPRAAFVAPLREGVVREIRPKLLAITAAAACVLLIAGANFASLLLARQIAREGDTGIRFALGASRGRLLREQLAHSLLLAVGGGAAGVLIAYGLIGPLMALSPMANDRTGNAMREFDPSIGLDGTLLAVSAGFALLVGLGFGLLPALRGTRGVGAFAPRGGARSPTLDRGTRRTLNLLVGAEIAAAFLLLTATGLMVKSFRNLLDEPWGFGLDHRLVVNVGFSDRVRPDHAARTAYIEQALERIRALAGVASASATTPDLVFAGRNIASITPAGSTPPAARGYFDTGHFMVFPGYFANAGVPILKGRPIDATDVPGHPRATVVSESFARHFWPGQDPLGKLIRRGRANDTRPPYRVVGVAADVKATTDVGDGELVGRWYLAYAQNPDYMAENVTLVAHTRVPPETLQAVVRRELAAVDPAIAPQGFSTLERLVDDTYVEDRFAALIVGLFGVLGLVLSTAGLYGLLAFQVARRTREIGIRSALGARVADITALVLRHALALVLGGVAAGLVLSIAFSRVLRSQLHHVGAADPTAYVGTALILGAAALLACYFPSRAAARVDPIVALRAE